MELLIVSDSHGRASALRQMLQRQLKRPEAVLFLGDGLRDIEALDLPPERLVAVRGNCDLLLSSAFDVPEERLLCFGEYRFLICHGHRYGVKSGVGALLSRAVQCGADAVLYGHTHQPFEQTVPIGSSVGGSVLQKPIHLFNPGSVAEGSFGTLTVKRGALLFSHGSLS